MTSSAPPAVGTALSPGNTGVIPNRSSLLGSFRHLPLRNNIGPLLLAVVVLCIGSLGELSVALVMRDIVDNSFASDTNAAVNQHFLQLLAVIMILAAAAFGRTMVTSWIGERLVRDIRRDVFRHVLRLSPGFYDRTSNGEILSRLTSDVTVLQEFTAMSLPGAMRSVFMIVGGTASMLLISPTLTLMLAMLVPVLTVPFLIGGAVVRRRARINQNLVGEATRYAEEILSGIQTVQAFAYESVASQAYVRKLDDAYRSALSRVRASAVFQGVIVLMTFAMIDLVLFMGARELMAGKISGGQLAAFVILAMLVSGGFSGAGHLWGELSRASSSAERISELLTAQPAIIPPANPIPLPKPVRGLIQFRGIRFSYPARPDAPALHNFNLDVQPGETVALVGPSGAGKSSVFKLLLRYYDPSDGAVSIDGTDVRLVDLQELRSVVAIVSQEAELFTGTAMENIRFGLSSATDRDVQAAARRAAAAEFIESTPEGYASLLGPRGRSLSGGQRQRMAIARAVLRESPILLFDEATSSLDSESEALIRDSISALEGRCTMIIIAHRLATVRHADRIVVMDQGRINAIGKHDELLKQGGLYARLAQSQFAKSDA